MRYRVYKRIIAREMLLYQPLVVGLFHQLPNLKSNEVTVFSLAYKKWHWNKNDNPLIVCYNRTNKEKQKVTFFLVMVKNTDRWTDILNSWATKNQSTGRWEGIDHVATNPSPTWKGLVKRQKTTELLSYIFVNTLLYVRTNLSRPLTAENLRS